MQPPSSGSSRVESRCFCLCMLSDGLNGLPVASTIGNRPSKTGDRARFSRRTLGRVMVMSFHTVKYTVKRCFRKRQTLVTGEQYSITFKSTKLYGKGEQYAK